MKKIFIVIVAVIMVFALTACNGEQATPETTPEPDPIIVPETTPEPDPIIVPEPDIPRNSPQLFVVFTEGEQSTQRIQSIQGVTNWFWGDGGYLSDSPHPLQIHFDDATLFLNNQTGEIELEFSGEFMPIHITARRWSAEYATGTQPSDEMFNNWEEVEVNGKTIGVINDGNNYIYEVTATWPIYSSTASYAFRVISE
ncbi:MAG: hypothetical protein FWD05_11680 [Oscillospiraceae bacterium]|nr:hypothetical protein [Oscillospiraceae bacterium]